MITVFKLIFAGIKALFKFLFFCLKFLYKLFKALKVRILVLYLIVAGLLQLIFRLFDGKMVFFWVGVGICLLLTLWGWGRFLKENMTRRRLKEANEEAEAGYDEEEEEQISPPPVEKHSEPPAEREIPTPPKPEQPKLYAVEGRAGYYFTEYADRYELYYRTEHGYEYIRTDYKTEKP